ncbi:hypothetical protein DMENIID0001_016610 [Sergentomyia squamirostris]
MKFFVVFALCFAAVMGSDVVLRSERFGTPLFRDLAAAPILSKELIRPIAHDGQYYPELYQFPYEDRHYPYYNGEYRHIPYLADGTYHGLSAYDINSEAITTDLRYNLPYGYARNGLLY